MGSNREIAAKAAARLGRNASSTTHVRTGTNALYRCEDIAVRVCAPGYDPINLAQQLELISYLRTCGFPTPAMIGDGPLSVDGTLVTAWEWIDTRGAVTAHEVGNLTRDFHKITAHYQGPVPEWNPLERASSRLATAADSLPPSDSAMLRRQIESLADATRHDHHVPWGIVHGDMHDGNVLASRRGLLLLDFERFSHGPLEWDLAQRVVGASFFTGASTDEWHEFLGGYGGFETSPAFDALVLTRALVMTTWLLTLPRGPRVDQERQSRLEFWRRRDAGLPRSSSPGWAAI